MTTLKFLVEGEKMLPIPEPSMDYPNKEIKDKERIAWDLNAIKTVLNHCGEVLDLKVQDPDYLNPTLVDHENGVTHREYLERIKYALTNGLGEGKFSNSDIEILREARAPYINFGGISQ